MNHAIRKTFAVVSLGAAGLLATGAAQAGGVNWHIGINLPGVVYPAPPVVYGPPPVVYAPPPPVVYRPAPIYYQPAPVYVYPRHRGHWREGHWHDRRHRHGDWDGDGRYEGRYEGRRGHYGH